MEKLTLIEIAESINRIPVLPKTLTNVINLLNEPSPEIKKIEKEIMKDQGLTAKLLKMSNSAFYGGRRSIDTVKDATVLLGFNSVETLVLSSYAKEFMNEALTGYSYKKEDLWNYSFSSAIIAKKIAKKVKFENPDVAYTAGLLKDIGKVVLDKYIVKHREDIVNIINEKKFDYLEAEEEVLGFNHCQIGAKIAGKWNLSRDLIEAIEFQHKPLKASSNIELVSIIHLADLIVFKNRTDQGSENESYKFYEESLKILNLNKNHLSQFSDDLITFLKSENIEL